MGELGFILIALSLTIIAIALGIIADRLREIAQNMKCCGNCGEGQCRRYRDWNDEACEDWKVEEESK